MVGFGVSLGFGGAVSPSIQRPRGEGSAGREYARPNARQKQAILGSVQVKDDFLGNLDLAKEVDNLRAVPPRQDVVLHKVQCRQCAQMPWRKMQCFGWLADRLCSPFLCRWPSLASCF